MNTNITTKRTSKVITVFYLLIAFEFFYMASPFAIYFYSVYKPGLSVLDNIPVLSGLTNFFLPHIAVDTKSPILNKMHFIGGSFMLIGLIIFFICAFQVYYSKIAKKGAVTGGLYKIIRHPQYTGFALSGFGMLLLWPRFLILITFISILFVYYFLAKIEERECELKFGKSYLDYKNRTFRFLPFIFPFQSRLSLNGFKRLSKISIIALLYVISITLSICLADGFRSLSINSLYTSYKDNEANLSITKSSEKQIINLIEIATNNPQVDSLLQSFKNQKGTYFLNYILPSDIFYISEIPMYIPQNAECNYGRESINSNVVKVVLTKAIVDTRKKIIGKAILLNTKFTEAIAEVWIDRSSNKITRIIPPQKGKRYKNIPVPVF